MFTKARKLSTIAGLFMLATCFAYFNLSWGVIPCVFAGDALILLWHKDLKV